MDMFRPIPCFSAGASFLLQGFFLCSILPILGPQRLRSWSSHIWIGNSLRWTRIFMWCNVLLRIERCDPIPKILCSSVKSTWISLALYPEIRKPKVLSSSIKAFDPCHHFSSKFCWVAGQPQHVWTGTYRRICIPIQCRNLEIREDTNNHATASYNFLWGNSCTVFDVSFRMDYFTWERFLLKVFFRHFVSGDLGAGEEDCVLFSRWLSSWRKLQESPLEHRLVAFHW